MPLQLTCHLFILSNKIFFLCLTRWQLVVGANVCARIDYMAWFGWTL